MTDTDLITIPDDGLSTRSREEVEDAARKWFDIATDMRDVQDQLVGDLEAALNACRSYQGILARLNLNDPNLVAVRRMLIKYKMNYAPTKTYQIFADGVDITEHPDSIEGDVEVIELTSEEYYGTTTVELVQTEDGGFHCLPKGEEVSPETGWNPDPIPVKRPWLIEKAMGMAHWVGR